jgi:ornithine decarboxylase
MGRPSTGRLLERLVVSHKQLRQLAQQHGTPLFVVDHHEIRRNYAMFRKHLPRVQAYYAVKANPDPAIVKTLFDAGASFDVASMPEFNIVHENIKSWPAKKRQDFIWDKIVYANPVKDNRTLADLDPYKPLSPMTTWRRLARSRSSRRTLGWFCA